MSAPSPQRSRTSQGTPISRPTRRDSEAEKAYLLEFYGFTFKELKVETFGSDELFPSRLGFNMNVFRISPNIGFVVAKAANSDLGGFGQILRVEDKLFRLTYVRDKPSTFSRRTGNSATCLVLCTVSRPSIVTCCGGPGLYDERANKACSLWRLAIVVQQPAYVTNTSSRGNSGLRRIGQVAIPSVRSVIRPSRRL
uniref:Uncharacterized protein n=1 Tax=Coccidioides posadasii RMSCC 3488 TaxID=454284 RepID=A0A0J6FPC5_COCPO|nr:hypothetical protein CPAG_07602 [Coccidioides posadasii RMSCC 3488]